MNKISEQIERKINEISENAVNIYHSKFNQATRDASILHSIGFTNSLNVGKNKLSSKDFNEIERAKLFSYFGLLILTDKEINDFENKYRLKTFIAQRFLDEIPYKNTQEILKFISDTRENKWNYGRNETENYYIPLQTPYMVTAPPELFRKALNTSEMSPEEYKKWLEDDPIITKKIYKFVPKDQENLPTIFNGVITAWGMEEILLNRN